MKRISFISIISLFVLSLLITPTAFAANTTIEVYPKAGSYGESFTADIVIDGHGDVFNAAESTVALSPNLTVKDLTLGDCNFSYLSTPSIENLSFSGIILSGSSKKCTVYSVILSPNQKGKGTVTLSKGSVRRYGDAASILSSQSNASYTLTGAASKPAVKGEQTKSNANSLYTVNMNVVVKKNEPLADATVLLASASANKTLEKRTNAEGKTQFTNLQPGIYYATVKKDNKEVAKTIVNVKGANKTLTFGINLENQKNNPLFGSTTVNILGLSPLQLGGILVLGMLLGIGLFFLLTKIRKRK